MMLTFYGTETSVRDWTKVVKSRVGKDCSPVVVRNEKGLARAYTSCNLTLRDRDELTRDWNAGWNHKIGFKAKEGKRK